MPCTTSQVLIVLSLFALGVICDLSRHNVAASTMAATNGTESDVLAAHAAAANSTSNGGHYYLNPNATHHYSLTIAPAGPAPAGLKVNNFDAAAELDQRYGDDSFATSEAASRYERHLERSSVIFGLSRVVNASTVSPICYAQLKRVERSIVRREPWAMKVLDASGTKPSGFVFGQNFWLGSRDACEAAIKPVSITLSRNYERVMHYALITESAPFAMDYRVVYLRHHSPWQVEIKLMSEQIIHIGLCLPSACASSEIQALTADYMAMGLFVENDIYDIRPEVIYMKDLKLSNRFYERPTVKLVTGVLAFTGAMMLLAAYLRMQAVAEAERAATALKNDPKADGDLAVFTPPPLVVGAIKKMQDFIKCFDIIENFQSLCATKENAVNEIPIINGLRSVSALWILVFHVFWFMYFTVNNKPFLISFAERFAMQCVASAPLLVDVFFTISGFLQTYNFLRNAKKMAEARQNTFFQNVKNFLKMLMHRYLRLGPLYLAVVGVVDLFYTYISEVSVFHLNERFDEYCSAYWWRNVLFIQNFFDHNTMCLNWTWSLACEMQYFILASILLLTYAKHPKLVKTTVVLLLLSTIAWSFHIGVNTKFQLSFDATFATGNDIYISPFVRILPYILGAVTGWLLLELQPKAQLSETQDKAVWYLSLLIFLSCFYSTIWRDMSPLLCTGLFVMGRFAFSMCICWMIVGSSQGRGVWWSRILEAKVFQHLNRLSYAIYLLNPFVIAFFFSLNNASTQADPFMMSILTTGFTVIVYLTSVVFSMAFEIPYCNWSGMLLRGGSGSVKQKAT